LRGSCWGRRSAKCAICQVNVKRSEIHTVEKIEELEAHLEGKSFSNLSVLVYVHVSLEEIGRTEGVGLLVFLRSTRVNSSFGSIGYTTNDRRSNYQSVYFEFKGRFARGGFFDASYTRSSSKDNASAYPARRFQVGVNRSNPEIRSDNTALRIQASIGTKRRTERRSGQRRISKSEWGLPPVPRMNNGGVAVPWVKVGVIGLGGLPRNSSWTLA
jgi:hypothetical protein